MSEQPINQESDDSLEINETEKPVKEQNKDKRTEKHKGDDVKQRSIEEKNNEAKSEVKLKIDAIESKKKTLIDDIRKLNRELKMKTMEYEAVKKLAEKASSLGIDKLLRELRSLEFKMSTQTINPASEKKFIRRVIELERELAKARPYMNARKRVIYLEERIKKVNSGITEIEKKLNAMRSDLNDLYRKYKTEKRAKKSGVRMSENKEEDFMTLEDVVEIEDENEDRN